MTRHVLALSMALLSTLNAWAEPRRGGPVPHFSVEDIAGATHTQRELNGQWSVLFMISDKDAGPLVAPWFHRLHSIAPRVRLITMAALDLFPLVPTATIVSQARESTPRAGWVNVWLSRNGSLAESLGLPESEVPWVVVVAPNGRVAEVVHSVFNETVLARITAALPSPPAAPTAPSR
jgi:hypothetical protein